MKKTLGLLSFFLLSPLAACTNSKPSPPSCTELSNCTEETSGDLDVDDASHGGPAVITSVLPTEGVPGTIVTIDGTGFDSLLLAHVQFGSLTESGASAALVYISPTQILTVVPDGASTGPLYVVDDSLGKNAITSEEPFAPLPAPNAR